MGRKDATSLGDFPPFSNGTIVATLQMRGQWASEKDYLNIDSNSWRAKGPNDLRNAGGMLSKPAPNCIIRLKFLQMLLFQILLNFFLNTMEKGFTYLY